MSFPTLLCRSARLSLAPLLLALLSSTTFSSPAQAARRPKLGVLLVFDQLPAWLFDRYRPFFDGGHFGGLDGADFDAIYPYASTETGPGHATLATCALPSVHGIATNSWFHDGKKLYAVDDPAFPVLLSDGKRADYGRSPVQLLTNTLSDSIKLESGGRARVVTLSHKDRAAILTAGRAADLAIWYDVPQGRYTTSLAYADRLPLWLEELGAALPAKALAEGTWSPLPVPRGLEALVPADDRKGEGALKGFDGTFPHDLKDVDAALKKSDYRLVPQSISDLFALALRAVDEEGLGKDDEPDLLVISVSTTDVVGHNYGGGSLEQLDTLRRADRDVRAFVTAVEARVGRGNLVVALTSDHGAPDLPEAIRASGLATVPLGYADVIDPAEKAAAAAGLSPGGKKRVRGFFPPQLFLDDDDLDAAGKQKLRDVIGAAVAAVPGIAQVYDMTPGLPDKDAYAPFMRNSAPPGRSAALFIRWDPRAVMMEEKDEPGTDHGTPYLFDRRVPFLLKGPGVRRGRYAQPVDTRDISATLAFLLGVSPPDSCQGRPVTAVGER